MRDALVRAQVRARFAAGVVRHYFGVILHKAWVAYYLLRYSVAVEQAPVRTLVWRALVHDLSKFRWDEARGFAKTIWDLKKAPYDSAEYRALLEQIRPSIDRHYRRNRHHPEWHRRGFAGMSSLDKIEMVADWRAAGRRSKNGNLASSIAKNKKRFGYYEDDVAELRRIGAKMGAL